jgi:hypothetical protein
LNLTDSLNRFYAPSLGKPCISSPLEIRRSVQLLLLLSHGSAVLLHFTNMIDRIHLLNVHRIDVLKA